MDLSLNSFIRIDISQSLSCATTILLKCSNSLALIDSPAVAT
jgi:hypothetical protein